MTGMASGIRCPTEGKWEGEVTAKVAVPQQAGPDRPLPTQPACESVTWEWALDLSWPCANQLQGLRHLLPQGPLCLPALQKGWTSRYVQACCLPQSRLLYLGSF